MIAIDIGLHKAVVEVSYKDLRLYMGASEFIRSNRVQDHTRSIPPFHTCLKDPLHTSVPYL